MRICCGGVQLLGNAKEERMKEDFSLVRIFTENFSKMKLKWTNIYQSLV